MSQVTYPRFAGNRMETLQPFDLFAGSKEINTANATTDGTAIRQYAILGMVGGVVSEYDIANANMKLVGVAPYAVPAVAGQTIEYYVSGAFNWAYMLVKGNPTPGAGVIATYRQAAAGTPIEFATLKQIEQA